MSWFMDGWMDGWTIGSCLATHWYTKRNRCVMHSIGVRGRWVTTGIQAHAGVRTASSQKLSLDKWAQPLGNLDFQRACWSENKQWSGIWDLQFELLRQLWELTVDAMPWVRWGAHQGARGQHSTPLRGRKMAPQILLLIRAFGQHLNISSTSCTTRNVSEDVLFS